MIFFIGVTIAYFIGSFPTAFLAGKCARGIDIRQHGSGNVGATNVFRVIGKKWGVGVLLSDMLKGAVAVYIASIYSPAHEGSYFLYGLIFGLAAIAGHTWTIWLRFKGGKGVATSLGVLLALAPKAAGAAIVVWICVFAWKRYVSLASLAMAASFPVWVLGFYRNTEFFSTLFPISLGLPLFIWYTHRGNIRRLRRGEEKKLI